MMGRILPLAAFAPLAVLVHFGLKRLLNLGMSRWWLLAFFAPVLNLWLGYRCMTCPSGYAHHKKMDAPGIAMAGLYWLAILVVVFILVSAVAPLVGAIDGAQLPPSLRTWIQRFSA